jgi:hypothetical protein
MRVSALTAPAPAESNRPPQQRLLVRPGRDACLLGEVIREVVGDGPGGRASATGPDGNSSGTSTGPGSRTGTGAGRCPGEGFTLTAALDQAVEHRHENEGEGC